MYAYRHREPLVLLQRSPADVGCVAGTRPCVVVASEPITDEPWCTVPEGTLLEISRTRPVTVLRSESAGVVTLPRTADGVPASLRGTRPVGTTSVQAGS